MPLLLQLLLLEDGSDSVVFSFDMHPLTVCNELVLLMDATICIIVALIESTCKELKCIMGIVYPLVSIFKT